ncbi:unnamed protein product [Microthlaspi erraticum]|uniref:Uncharacterized protein n=1 Tax=Microthlaspi erraticum TaxID=1685480 RepID=A0A6D2KGY9_9BRAS|nr:unnamed protein product [Microthlaspi erraticum]
MLVCRRLRFVSPDVEHEPESPGGGFTPGGGAPPALVCHCIRIRVGFSQLDLRSRLSSALFLALRFASHAQLAEARVDLTSSNFHESVFAYT